MQSMVKREVSLSITEHSEFIRQMILDGLEVARYRCEKHSINPFHMLRSNSIYYRNMRQNGHSAALRTVFNSKEFEDVGVISVFLDNKQRVSFRDGGQNRRRYDKCLFSEDTIFSEIDILRGCKVEVLVLNDYISINAIKRGWDMLESLSYRLPHLKLVVFLG